MRFMRLDEEETGIQLLAFWTAIYLPPPPWIQPLHGALVCTAGALAAGIQCVKMEKEVSFLGVTMSCRGVKELVYKS